MKHWSLSALAYLLNGELAAGSKLPANCATTTVLSVITTTMCSAGSPAVPTALVTGNGNVPGQDSLPASAPSGVIPGSAPHVPMSHGSAESPSAGTNENTAKESEAHQTGAGPRNGEASGATQAVKPTTAPAASASNGGSESNPIAPGQASSVTGQDTTATGTTSETSETPEIVPVSGASSSENNARFNAMIAAGIVACFAPMMIHL